MANAAVMRHPTLEAVNRRLRGGSPVGLRFELELHRGHLKCS